jgi:hypothetical protein
MAGLQLGQILRLVKASADCNRPYETIPRVPLKIKNMELDAPIEIEKPLNGLDTCSPLR